MNFDIPLAFGFCHLNFTLSLGSFKEIDAIAFFQGDDGLLPIGSPTISSSQAFDFTQNIASSYFQHLHLEETFDSGLNLNLIRTPVNFESVLTARLFLLGAFFSNQRPSDDLIDFLHDASTPWILWTAGLNKIKYS